MARCISCGKSGLFLRVNDSMRCKTCAEREKAEAERKKAEDERKLEEERLRLEEQRKQAEAQAKAAQRQTKTYWVSVAGVKYYLDNLQKLSYHNADFDLTKRELVDYCMVFEKVWERKFFAETIRFISEPDNPHDPNAIRVEIEYVHIGYIPARECAHIAQIVEENRIANISFEITGGKYKYVDVDYSDTGREVYTLERGEKDFSISIKIEEYVN